MNGPLSGIRVIDSTTMVAMPTATHILGDMGAEVIKIENHLSPRGEAGTFPDNDPGVRSWDREGNFNAVQRSKLGITLNLRSDEGIATFKELARVSDVIVENNRAGSMDRLGLGYEDLRQEKPDLIYMSNTGFGYTGPWRQYAGIGRMFELTCGLSQFTGYPDEGPRRVGSSFFDLHVGWTAVFAILSALLYRRETGRGQWIDFAMYQIGASTMGDAILDFVANNRNGSLKGNRHPYFAPHGVYPCKGDDKWIAIAVENDQQWLSLSRVMGNPSWAEDDKFSDAFSRWKNQDELDEQLRQWTKDYENLELHEQLQGEGVPAGPVLNNKELFLDPHVKERGFYEKITHDADLEIGSRYYFGRAWKMSKTPAFIRKPGPSLGQHNEFVFAELLGLTEDQVDEMYELNITANEPLNPRPPNPPTSLEKQVEDGTLAGYDLDYMETLELEQDE